MMPEPRLPKYQWGQRVKAVTDLMNDGSFPGAAAEARLVAIGDTGEIVQVGRHPAISSRNRCRIAWPCAVCRTSGWNCTPARPRETSSKAATGAPSVTATVLKPAGAENTASPCDIHTCCASGSPPSRLSLPRSRPTPRRTSSRSRPPDPPLDPVGAGWQAGGMSPEDHATDDLSDVKAKMRAALDRKNAKEKGVHEDTPVREKAHGSEVRGAAGPKMHRRKAGGGGS